MKCEYCKNKATRYHARHDNGKLENLCEKHYAVWHPEFSKWKSVGVCEICGEECDSLDKHHVSYLPCKIILICSFCHNRIHHGSGLEEFKPPEGHGAIYHSVKGAFLRKPTDAWVFLSDVEKELRKRMMESEREFYRRNRFI